jgi:hypothetical protein
MMRGAMTPGVNVDWLDLASDAATRRALPIDTPLDRR